MDFYDFLAVLGALAWLVPLISWIRNLLLKPKLSIISHKELEIGYTTLVPILNINLAFSVEKKEALIKKIDIILRHENNETHQFSWDWFEEQVLQMEIPDPDLGSMPFKKNQKAIAIKVLTDTLIERKIGFQKEEFKEAYNKLFNSTNEIYNNIYQSSADIDSFKISKEYNEFLDYFKNSFIWKVGKYSAKIKVYIEHVVPFEHDLNFQLTNLELKGLETNINTCQKTIKNHYTKEDPGYKADWKFVNPYKIEQK